MTQELHPQDGRHTLEYCASDALNAAIQPSDMMAQLEAIFLEGGLRKTTMASLARELRCSNRALYALAHSKAALFLVVLDRWLARIRTLGLEGASRHNSPIEKIQAYLAPGVSETRLASPRLMEDINALPAALDILVSHQIERMRVIEAIVAEGTRQGSFRNVNAVLVAQVLLSAVKKIDEPNFEELSGMTFSEALDDLYRLVLHGLILSTDR